MSRRNASRSEPALSRLWFTALVWKGLQERADANGVDMGIDPRAVSALLTAASKNVPALVELRCDKSGHLLAAVHPTQHGPLLWTTHTRDKAPPAVRREISTVTGGNVGLKSMMRTLAFKEQLLSGDRDREWKPVFCRCGSNLLDYREMFDAAAVALKGRRTLQVCAASAR